MNSILRIDPRDTVAVALRDLPAGTTVPDLETPTREAIAAKHKVALQAFAVGDPVHMYGVVVGAATRPIRAGEAISTGNVVHEAEPFGPRSVAPADWSAPVVSRWENTSFAGYHRPNGDVGTANHWIVVPMVFCENRNLQVIREALREIPGLEPRSGYPGLVADMVSRYQNGEDPAEAALGELGASAGEDRLFPNVDGVKFLTHGLGCGGTRGDAGALCALLAGYITHPNVAGATVLSLGCENAEVRLLEEEIARRDPSFAKPLDILVQQSYPSEAALMTDAIRRLFEGLTRINEQTRQPAPLNKLCLGMECGASDGFSGISSNPVLGQVSDLVVALGGRTILSEFPELCGVEQEMINRCSSEEAARDFETLMRRYHAWAEAVGSALHMNPSPGNIADGLITDAIKSAGAAKKGGTSPVTDVLDYTEPVRQAGLNLLCTPGNDVESTTAMAASGATVMLFSTGLGTPTGNPVVPTIKVSSNTELARRMPDLIDFDAGPIIRGEAGLADLGADLLEQVVATASGEYRPKAIRLGQDDFLPWKRGVSL